MAADHVENALQDVADADAAEGQSAALDAEHEVLHLEREDLGVDHRVRLPAPLAHQVTRLVPVELGHRAEQVQEVAPVRLVQLCHQARVDED